MASFTYDGTTPRLLSADDSNGLRAVRYDAAGNEVGVGTDTAMIYTGLNRLQRWKEISYTYDGRGVRTITSRPVRVVSVSIVPASVTGGASAQGTATLSSPAPAAGAPVTLSSDQSFASVPSSVTVSAGQTAATFAIATTAVSGEMNATVTASFNGWSAKGTLTVTGSRIDQVQLPQSVVGGAPASGTITLAAPAPEEGLTLALRSSDVAVAVPSEIAVRGGATSVAFTASTTPVSQPVTATISVLLDAERHDAALTVVPPSIAAFTFASRTIRGGSSDAGTIALDGPAPERGISIALQSDSRLLSVPASVAVAPGERSVTFGADTTPVESDAQASVTAMLGERATAASVTIAPPVLTELSVTPATAVGGDIVVATPVIDGSAAASGAAVALSTSDPSLVAAPLAMTIPAGATSEPAPLQTNPVAANTPVVVSASRQGVTRSTTLTLQPPPVTLASLALASAFVVGTNDVRATITLTAPAPANGLEVELTSSNPAVASVPPVVTVPEGATAAAAIVTTSLVSADTQVTISALHATTQKTAALSVLRPSGNYVAAIAIAPSFIVGGTSAAGTITLAMPSDEHGGSSVVLVSSDPAISVPADVKVNPNAASAAFSVATTAVSAPVPAVVTASFGGVIQRARIVVGPENAVTLQSLSIAPDRVTGGTPAMATVTLSRPAPFGGASVTIEARRRNIVRMPGTVLVAEGATSASFTISTDPLHAAREKAVEIVATYNNVAASTTLTVLPTPQASSKTASPIALCASLTPVPCLTQSTLRAVKQLGGQDGGPPPPSGPTLYESQYTFYSPELNLLSETSPASGAAPAIAYDYVWFGGQPLAQIENATGAVRWYFNDHLRTPLRQTDATGRIVWNAEYEPYGTIYAIRTGESLHQPLRLPGQTAEEGADLYQNVFRWYRSGWGRYTQPDPMNLSPFVSRGDRNVKLFLPYSYADDNPIVLSDSLGLDPGGGMKPTYSIKCISNCGDAYTRDMRWCDFFYVNDLAQCSTGLMMCVGKWATGTPPWLQPNCKKGFEICKTNSKSRYDECTGKALVVYTTCLEGCCRK